MARLLMFLVPSALALFVQFALADAYKCKAPDGAIKYQERPCADGLATVARVRVDPSPLAAPVAAESAESIRAMNERAKAQAPTRFDPDAKTTLVMVDISVRDQFLSMAGFCSCTLVMDPSISGGNSNVRYENVSWSFALADLAARHGAVATYANGVVTVKRR